MPREKSRYRDRRSLSYSSDSSYDKRKSKSKHKRRSRSRNRSVSSSRRRKRSSSRPKHRRRSYSRSKSRDRYESKSRRRSTSRSRSKRSSRRSLSRDRSKSRSSSRSRKYNKKSRSHRKSRSSSSRSGSRERPSTPKKIFDDTEIKVEKAIKAAEAAGLTLTKIPPYEYKHVEVKKEMPSIQERHLLAEINNDSFVQKPFVSSRNKKQQNIVIDLNTDTVKLPEADLKVEKDDSIINFVAVPCNEELKEMWIKKLYTYRKQFLKGEL